MNIKYGKRKILENVDLKFKNGTITVIKGVSGSGKSSLLNILGLLQRPNSECKYTINGEPINFNDDKQKALIRLNNIGFVFQQNNLLTEFTAIENIKIPLKLISKDKEFIEKKSTQLINYVGLSAVSSSYISELSGGEEQRAAIARALANDADVILADEPTASLDEYNSRLILNLFEKLAHELNKTVIIVSHDPQISLIGDKVFEIEDLKINLKFDNKKNLDLNEKEANPKDKKQLKSFIAFYRKRKKQGKLFSKVLITITSIIAAIATLFLNFGNLFTQQQKNFINAISENNILVVNDISKYKNNLYQDNNVSLTEDQLENINNIKNIKRSYDFFTFNSEGNMLKDKRNERAQITIIDNNGNQIKNLIYNNSMIDEFTDGPDFHIEPLYLEQNIKHILEFSTENYRDGIILTNQMAKILSESPKDLIGKKIIVDCLVPTKLYESKVTNVSYNNTSINDNHEINLPICTIAKIESKITGILPPSYNIQRCLTDFNFMLMDYEKMYEILEKNRNHDIGITPGKGFPEKEWSPNALMIFSDNFNNLEQIKSDLKNISSNFVFLDKAADIKTIENNLRLVKNSMTSISIILIGITIVLFGFLYYLKNKTRKKEIGILKAIGMTQRDIFNMITYETFIVATKTFVCSIILAFVFAFLGNELFNINLFVISIEAVVFCFLLSFITIIFSSIISIWKTSRINPIDAIRLNK